MSDLAEEAAFADRAYLKHADQLSLNETLLRAYTHPAQMWDWRHFQGKLLGSVEGRRLLDYGCGGGEEAVYFATLGATVTAIDISPVGVHLTRQRADANGVHVDARIMRCDPTEFPSASFDVIHGLGILHHVGVEAGLHEVHRLLAPGGRALFFEHMGNCAFIERLRPKDESTSGERPLRWQETVAAAAAFSRRVLRPYHLIARLRLRIPICNSDLAKCIDHALLSMCPPLRYFASGLVIYLEK